ncbi:MAG: SRPBCC domain-containing protein [Flavobacteriaceae bacterium]|nr:SRPBCC domain-containing protein [Flavobacteriaceae bacterium]
MKPQVNTIYHSFTINAAAKKIFDAISLPKHLVNWWPLKCSGMPIVDTEYNFNFTDAYNWYGKVTVCKPNTAFFIKMTKADEDWNPTTFGFELEVINKTKTKVHFSHANWPKQNAHFKHSSFCWAILLHGLKNYIEKGIIIPFEERE